MKSSKPNRHDLIPCALILLLAVLSLVLGSRLLGGSGDVLTAEIAVNGTVTETYILSALPEQGRSLTLENNGVTMNVLLERSGVSVLDATCRGNDCVKTGKITKAGRSIVCLPGRIVITLRGTDADTGIDIYAG